MHKASLEHMKLNVEEYLTNSKKIIDIGSLNVKNKNNKLLGDYKDLFKNKEYIGVDITKGHNVDVVMPGPYTLPFKNESFDAVITGQCFEHVKNPFKLIKECSRVLNIGGYFIGVAPYKWYIHRVPVDCWRILPDGWEALFEEVGLVKIETYVVKIDAFCGDSWGIAKKC